MADADDIKWQSFWDLATPTQASAILNEWYGSDAATVAAHCAFTANADLRDEDYRFWLAVFTHLAPVDAFELRKPREEFLD